MVTKLRDFSLCLMRWKQDPGWLISNDLIIYEHLPEEVINKQPITSKVKSQIENMLLTRAFDTYFMAIWDNTVGKEDKLVRTVCTSLDGFRDLRQLFLYWGLIEESQ